LSDSITAFAKMSSPRPGKTLIEKPLIQHDSLFSGHSLQNKPEIFSSYSLIDIHFAD